jgi:DNA-binding transcriptional LysR family regulator
VVSGQGAQAKGLLRMAMSGSFARMYIIPTLSEFRTRYPQVDLDLRLSDEIHDVIEGGYDLIIRNAELADSSLMARKLATDCRIVLAAPSYLEKHGTPTTPAALSNHQCLNFNGNNKWHFQNGQSITTNRSLSVNDGEAMRTLIENGLGIGIKSLWNASESLKAGRVVEILSDYPLVTKPSIWALYPGNRVIAPKVRVMIDFLVGVFSPVPPWER